MIDVSELTPAERAEYYLRLAQDAMREAETAPGAARTSYLIIAEQFKRLATVAKATRSSENEAS
jgi:hypothetical protein